MSRPTRNFYEFGSFRLDTANRLLIKDGEVVTLKPKVFDTLLALVEHSGDVLEKDALMRRVWPDTVVEENNLSQNISALRKALGENPGSAEYIQTLPRRGYRFIAEVKQLREEATEALVEERTRSTITIEEEDEITDREGSTALCETTASNNTVRRGLPRVHAGLRWRIWLLTGTAIVLIVFGILAVRLMSPLSPPRILNLARITNDGQQKTALVADGSRLYIAELVENKPTLAQVSLAGGETVPLSVPFANPSLDDISPTTSELIVASNDGPYPYPYWLVPVTGGSPRRLGDIRAHDLHPSPDGKLLAYLVDSDLYLAKSDATESRKVMTLNNMKAGGIAWAPDGGRLRFTAADPKTQTYSIWEVAADGTNLHPLLPGWNTPAAECCGHWTPDGEYFFFESKHNGLSAIWAIREKTSLLRKASSEPVQLSLGQISFRNPVPSQDGKRIFAIGDQIRAEIMRYDSRSEEWIPYISRVSMAEPSFSRDGEWITYTTYPEETLWRSRVDGSQAQQLTFAPLEATSPCWSPDAKRIAFQGRLPGGSWKIYLLSSEGGNPEQLIPGDGSQAVPSWSPDGNRIVFGGSPFFEHGSGPSSLVIFDLKTNQDSVVPGSEGCWGSRWSPDGRYILAHRFDFGKLMLFDLTAGKWEDLAKGILHFASWSRDSKYVYFESWGDDIAACRIKIGNRKLDKIGSLKEFRRTIGPERCWSGLAPDDSLLVLRDIGSQEVYALDLQLP